MKASSLCGIFLLIILLILTTLPSVSDLIDDNFIEPSQMVGNIGSFGISIMFPGLNNSYITEDPGLMNQTERMDFFDGTKDLPNKTYDVIIIGDSFTQPYWGFSNGISREGNLSTITFYLNDLKVGSYFKLIENLISSGFFESTKPKFIIIESAGRNDLYPFIVGSNKEDQIAFDIPTLNYLIRYGNRIDDIVSGIKPSTIIPLLNLSMERRWNHTPEWGEPCKVITYGGELALFDHPIPNDNVSAKFLRIPIPINTTLLTKIGLDPYCWKSGKSDGAEFFILASGEDETDTIIFQQYISPGEGFRLVALPLDKYAGKTLNLTLMTNIGNDGNSDWAYWVNPVLISYSSTSAFEARNNTSLAETIPQILKKIPTTLTNLHEKSIVSYIWEKRQYDVIFKVRDTIINTIKNQLDLSFDERIHKAKLTKRVHSSNVEYDTIYYHYTADSVRESYSYENTIAANNNLNNLSERLKRYNITLLFLKPPDTSHIYEEYYISPPSPKASRIYEDLKTIPKKYQYIDAYSLLMEHVHAGELDLYPILTTHWAPTAGSYVAKEIVRVITNITGGI